MIHGRRGTRASTRRWRGLSGDRTRSRRRRGYDVESPRCVAGWLIGSCGLDAADAAAVPAKADASMVTVRSRDPTDGGDAFRGPYDWTDLSLAARGGPTSGGEVYAGGLSRRTARCRTWRFVWHRVSRLVIHAVLLLFFIPAAYVFRTRLRLRPLPLGQGLAQGKAQGLAQGLAQGSDRRPFWDLIWS